MSELDGIKQGVERVRNEVAAAKVIAEQAQSTASDKVNEMAMLGLEGVAQVLQSVADTMSTAVARLGTGYTATDECVSGLKVVTDKTKMSETAAALDGGLQKLTETGTEVEGAGAQAGDALTHAQESEVEPVMNAVAAAITAIDQAKAAVEAAKVKAGEYRTKMDAAGRSLLTGSGGANSQPPERKLTATTGSAVQPPMMGPEPTSPYRAELNSSDDDDKTKNKFQRGLRAAVRSVGDLKDQSVDTTKPVYKILDEGWNPPSQDSYESTTHADSRPAWEAPPYASVEGHDVVGNLVALTVFGAELVSRGLRKGSAKSR